MQAGGCSTAGQGKLQAGSASSLCGSRSKCQLPIGLQGWTVSNDEALGQHRANPGCVGRGSYTKGSRWSQGLIHAVVWNRYKDEEMAENTRTSPLKDRGKQALGYKGLRVQGLKRISHNLHQHQPRITTEDPAAM